MNYKFLEHTADVKFQAFGKNLEEVFSNCALALGKTIYNGKVKKKIKKKIKIKGKDLENLLYNFLEEFLILFDSERFLISEISKIKINKKRFEIECEVLGDNSENYEIEMHVKSVTYNEMFIEEKKDKWIAQVVLDV